MSLVIIIPMVALVIMNHVSFSARRTRHTKPSEQLPARGVIVFMVTLITLISLTTCTSAQQVWASRKRTCATQWKMSYCEWTKSVVKTFQGF